MAIPLGLAAALSTAALLLPPVAQAGGFEAPVLLSNVGANRELYVAINDRGDGVEAYIDETATYCQGTPLPAAGRLVVQRLTASGLTGQPWMLAIPGYFPSDRASVAIDDQGHVAIGLLFNDWTSPSSCEPHSQSCCARAAVATWQLDGGPPALQVLSGAESGREPLDPPTVIVAHSRVTAVWTRGEDFEPAWTQVEQAVGQFGAPLRTAAVATTPSEIGEVALVAGTDTAVSWLGWSSADASRATPELYTAVGSPGGLLRRQTGGVRLLHLTLGFRTFADNGGRETVFAYVPGDPFQKTNEILTMTSIAGRAFSHRRVIGSIPEGVEPSLVAGDHRSLLLVWSGYSGRIFAERGSVFGPFQRPIYIGKTTDAGNAPGSFIDSHGAVVIVYTAHRHATDELLAVTAQPGRRFSRPQRIAPSLRACRFGLGESDSIVRSPDGHALVRFACQDKREYVIPYAP